MTLTIERPFSLSEQYSADVARLCRTERDAIIARHRMVFEQARLRAEPERLNPIKVFFS